MSDIGRREFCTAIGAGIVGLAALLAGCSSDDGAAPPASTRDDDALAGLSVEVRRDPG